MISPVRRVVVRARPDGTAAVVADEASPHVHILPGMPDDLGLTDLWYTGDGSGALFWHATETTDYNVLLVGELALLTDHGEVTLHPGDTVVVCGGRHAWSNRTNEPAALAAVSIA